MVSPVLRIRTAPPESPNDSKVPVRRQILPVLQANFQKYGFFRSNNHAKISQLKIRTVYRSPELWREWAAERGIRPPARVIGSGPSARKPRGCCCFWNPKGL